MTLREGRPLPAARTGLGGRPERGGLSPADSAEKRGERQRAGSRRAGKRPRPLCGRP